MKDQKNLPGQPKAAVAGPLNPTTSTEEGRYIGYNVVDRSQEKIGTIESVWLDRSGDPAYMSIKTGWLGMGRSYVVPTQNAEVSQRRQNIRIPFTTEQLRGAPEFDSSVQLQNADEERIGSYYGNHGFKREGWLEDRSVDTRSSEGKTVQLKEEQIKVGKRQVEAGGVRLRKVVRTETVNQPIELKREEIVIERVPANQAGAVSSDFADEEIYVPLRREEAVVSKEARVREEVRVGKREQSKQENISETIRKEDVEIEEGVTESRMNAEGQRGRPAPYQPKERSRN